MSTLKKKEKIDFFFRERENFKKDYLESTNTSGGYLGSKVFVGSSGTNKKKEPLITILCDCFFANRYITMMQQYGIVYLFLIEV